MRKTGHVRQRESVSDWERFWINVYCGERYSLRLVASLVYGIPYRNVTASEVGRVGRISRGDDNGVLANRNAMTKSAKRRIQDVAKRHSSHSPVRLRFPSKADVTPAKRKRAS